MANRRKLAAPALSQGAANFNGLIAGPADDHHTCGHLPVHATGQAAGAGAGDASGRRLQGKGQLGHFLGRAGVTIAGFDPIAGSDPAVTSVAGFDAAARRYLRTVPRYTPSSRPIFRGRPAAFVQRKDRLLKAHFELVHAPFCGICRQWRNPPSKWLVLK